jgi:hypothetical protein
MWKNNNVYNLLRFSFTQEKAFHNDERRIATNELLRSVFIQKHASLNTNISENTINIHVFHLILVQKSKCTHFDQKYFKCFERKTCFYSVAGIFPSVNTSSRYITLHSVLIPAVIRS